MRLADILKPKIILLENVRHLLSIDNGKVINKIIKSLQKIIMFLVLKFYAVEILEFHRIEREYSY